MQQRTHYFETACVNRTAHGELVWGKASQWQFTNDTATFYSVDDTPEALLSLRFLSADELEALPVDVKALSRHYQSETAACVVTTTTTATTSSVALSETTDDVLTDAHFWEAQQYFHSFLVALSENAARQSQTLEQPCVSWQRKSRTDTRIQLQKATASKDGEFSAELVVELPDALHFYGLSGNFFDPKLERRLLADSEYMEPFEVQTLRGKFERLPDGKYTNGTFTYDSLQELSRFHSWRSLAERTSETPAASALTEEQFWEAQKTVHQCLLELSEAAPPRQASYTVSVIRFKDYPQVSVRDVQFGSDGHWQATLVLQQPDSLWLYELTGDPDQYYPERLSLAATTEKRVRRILDSTKMSMPLRALLQGIQQLTTNELRVQALLMLHENTQVYLIRYAQKAFLIDLAEWLRDLEIVVEPQRVRTTDGFTLVRQPDGSYSDGDLAYESLQDLNNEHGWEEVV